MTKSQHWFDVAESLYNQNIAKAVVWLGDDYHEENANKVLKTDILNHVRYPYKIKSEKLSIYEGDRFELQNFSCHD
jgi:hypothetical protein